MSRQIERVAPLIDIEIQRGGDGRTVEAYAAVFDSPTEVADAHGHYFEVIRSSAFDKSLTELRPEQVPVFYNHGKDLHGNPVGEFSVPIATTLAIRGDGRGLRTTARYNKTDVAERVLEAIKAGSLKTMSFTARIFRNAPARPTPGSHLQTIERTELGLREYGPTPLPFYEGAGILAVRAADLLVDPSTVDELTDEQRQELLAALTRQPAPPEEGTQDDAPSGTPDTQASTPPEEGTSEPAPSLDTLRLLAENRRRRAS